MTATPKGFTLVELAIALMIIGLLIGGVLKGQELINNTRITRTIKDITDYRTAIIIFDSIYDALPGDTTNPEMIPNCTAPICTDAGDGTRLYEPTDMGNVINMEASADREYNIYATADRKNFWRHLSLAGLVSLSIPANTAPTSATWPNYYPHGVFPDTYMTIAYANIPAAGFDANAFFLKSAIASQSSIKARYALAIDTKMDDGKPNSGNIITVRNAISATTDCVITTDGETIYASQAGQGGCHLIFTMDNN